MTTYLVTGASGFLGRHLLHALQADEVPRRALALVREPNAWSRHDWTHKLERVELLHGELLDPRAFAGDPRLAEVRGVFHLAAEVKHSRHDVESVYRSNVEGTAGILRLAAERGWRVVFVSTSGTVGCFRRREEHADEETPPCEEAIRSWPYYHSKLLAERRARELAEQHGVQLQIVRPPVLLGPGDHRFRSSGHLIRLLRRRLPFVVDGGIAFADVRDASRAILRAMESPRPRPVYHLPGHECSVGDFFALASEISGVPPPPLRLPYPVAWWLAQGLAQLGIRLRGEPLHLLPDPVVVEMATHWWGLRSLYAESELGYRPRPARETLADTIAWLRQNHPALRP